MNYQSLFFSMSQKHTHSHTQRSMQSYKNTQFYLSRSNRPINTLYISTDVLLMKHPSLKQLFLIWNHVMPLLWKETQEEGQSWVRSEREREREREYIFGLGSKSKKIEKSRKKKKKIIEHLFSRNTHNLNSFVHFSFFVFFFRTSHSTVRYTKTWWC